MSKAHFTSGPWTLRPPIGRLRAISPDYVIDGTNSSVCTLGALGWEPDAHLIAAAPDLYVALRDFVLREGDWQSPLMDTATAALAKARGEV